jgi:hypothetical protein
VVAGRVLVVGGLLFFIIDMVAQPTEVNGSLWLDPGQIVALVTLVTGAGIFAGTPMSENPDMGHPIAAHQEEAA